MLKALSLIISLLAGGDLAVCDDASNGCSAPPPPFVVVRPGAASATTPSEHVPTMVATHKNLVRELRVVPVAEPILLPQAHDIRWWQLTQRSLSTVPQLQTLLREKSHSYSSRLDVYLLDKSAFRW